MPVRSFIGGPYHLQHWDHPETPDRLVVTKDREPDFTYQAKETVTEGDNEVVQVIYAPPGMSQDEYLTQVAKLPPHDHPRHQLL